MPIVSDSRRRLCCALPLLLCPAPSLQAADLAADKARRRCAACHGIDGLAKVADAPNPPATASSTARQLQAFRSGERKHPQMSVIAAGWVMTTSPR